jgi:hypothetical protein
MKEAFQWQYHRACRTKRTRCRAYYSVAVEFHLLVNLWSATPDARPSLVKNGAEATVPAGP